MKLRVQTANLAAVLVILCLLSGAAGAQSPGTTADLAKLPAIGSQMIAVQPGSIDDISAIGHRNVSGHRMGNLYSTKTELKLGREYAQLIVNSSRFITDPTVTETVNRIAQRIVANSDCKIPFTVRVIDSGEVNAFALPDGSLFVNAGLIAQADNEAELASVLAHETAHVCAHHAMREMTRLNYAQVGLAPVMVFAGGVAGEGAALALPATFLHFSHAFEVEADTLGVEYLYRAGYDPRAYISFFEKIQTLEQHQPGTVAKVFAEHPQTPDRVQRTEAEIERILPPRVANLLSTVEFDTAKARLTEIEEQRHKHLP